MNQETATATTFRDVTLPKGMRLIVYLWWIVLVLALWPYAADPVMPVKYFLTAGGIAILLLLLAWQAWQGNARIPQGTCLLGLYLAAQLPGLFRAENTTYALMHFQRDVVFAALAILVAHNFRDPAHRITLLRVMVVAVAVGSLYGLGQKIGLDPFPWSDRTRAEYLGLPASFGHPNFAAHVLAPMLVLCGGLIRHAFRSKQRIWTGVVIAAFLLMAVHLYFTQSRGAQVALIAAGLFLALFGLLMKGTKHFRLAVALTLLISIAGGVTAVIGGAQYLTTIEKPAEVPLDSSLLLRVNANVSALRMMQDRPWQGFGPGGYTRHAPEYWTHFEQHWYALYGKYNHHVHCELLETGVDGGYPALAAVLLLFLWAVIVPLHWTQRQPQSDTRWFGYILSGAIVVMVADSFFGFNLHAPVSRGLFFVLVGVVGSLHGKTADNEPPHKNRVSLLSYIIALIYSIILCLVTFGVIVEDRSFDGERFLYRTRAVENWIKKYEDEEQFDKVHGMLGVGETLAGKATVPWEACYDALKAEYHKRQGELLKAKNLFHSAREKSPYIPRYIMNDAYTALLLARMGLGDPQALIKEAESNARDALKLCAMYGPAQEVLGHAAALRAQLQVNAGEDPSATWQRAAEHLRLALRYGLDHPENTVMLLREVEAQLAVEEQDK